jgi:hypothetical protein
MDQKKKQLTEKKNKKLLSKDRCPSSPWPATEKGR